MDTMTGTHEMAKKKAASADVERSLAYLVRVSIGFAEALSAAGASREPGHHQGSRRISAHGRSEALQGGCFEGG